MGILKATAMRMLCVSLLMLAEALVFNFLPWSDDNLQTAAQARVHRARTTHRSPTTARSSSRSGSRSSRHQSRHQGRRTHRTARSAPKPKYAYSYDLFMMSAPDFDKSALSEDLGQRVRYAFKSGAADNYPPSYLVRSGAVAYYALRGGIYGRRERVKHIIIHSTETGVPQDGRHVIDAWSSGGRRHPGTQYIVDRDGGIIEALDPEFAAVHVNIFKTLPGINNDNSIGIEMCHAGSQTYPQEQRASVIRLVTYLQDRYHVLNENVITHRYAQQGDHTDPVNFDWEGFLAMKDDFRAQAIAMKRDGRFDDVVESDLPTASVYLEIHKFLDPKEVLSRKELTPAQLDAARKEVEDLTAAYGAGQDLRRYEMASPTSRFDTASEYFHPGVRSGLSTPASSLAPASGPIGSRPAATPAGYTPGQTAPSRYGIGLRGEIDLPPGTVNDLNKEDLRGSGSAIDNNQLGAPLDRIQGAPINQPR